MAKKTDRQLEGPAQSGGGFARIAGLAAFVGIAGALLYGLLSLVEPQYSSVAQIYIESREPSNKKRHGDKKLVAKGIADLRSSAFVGRFVEQNRLAEDRQFNEALVTRGPLERIAMSLGIVTDPAKLPIRRRVREAFSRSLKIARSGDAQTINIAVRSHSPQKAADFANQYANAYIDRLNMTSRAVAPETVIETVDETAPTPIVETPQMARWRQTITSGEEKIRSLQADLRNNPAKLREAANLHDAELQNRDAAASDVALDKQQMSSLVTRHILAKADREEAELRAKLVRDMLEDTGELHSTGKVLNSGLIEKLLIKRSRMERQVADLEVTLLPSHPNLKRLHREMTALKAQILTEARQVVTNLENEAKIAAVRETSLKDSLDKLKNSPLQPVEASEPVLLKSTVATDTRPAEIEAARATIADARQQLALALARQKQEREVPAKSLVSVPATTALATAALARATLITRAVAISTPVFPRKKEITLLGMLGAFVLGLAGLFLGRKSAPEKSANRGDVALAKDKPSAAETSKSAQLTALESQLQEVGGFAPVPVKN